jgi:hypothetical protein
VGNVRGTGEMCGDCERDRRIVWVCERDRSIINS